MNICSACPFSSHTFEQEGVCLKCKSELRFQLNPDHLCSLDLQQS